MATKIGVTELRARITLKSFLILFGAVLIFAVACYSFRPTGGGRLTIPEWPDGPLSFSSEASEELLAHLREGVIPARLHDNWDDEVVRKYIDKDISWLVNFIRRHSQSTSSITARIEIGRSIALPPYRDYHRAASIFGEVAERCPDELWQKVYAKKLFGDTIAMIISSLTARIEIGRSIALPPYCDYKRAASILGETTGRCPDELWQKIDAEKLFGDVTEQIIFWQDPLISSREKARFHLKHMAEYEKLDGTLDAELLILCDRSNLVLGPHGVMRQSFSGYVLRDIFSSYSYAISKVHHYGKGPLWRLQPSDFETAIDIGKRLEKLYEEFADPRSSWWKNCVEGLQRNMKSIEEVRQELEPWWDWIEQQDYQISGVSEHDLKQLWEEWQNTHR